MPVAVERRRARRYHLDVDVQYMALEAGHLLRVGAGHACNMSTSGLLIRTAAPLPRDCTIVTALRWPANRARRSSLLLVVFGRPIRTTGDQVAITVSHHEFLECDDYQGFRIDSLPLLSGSGRLRLSPEIPSLSRS